MVRKLFQGVLIGVILASLLSLLFYLGVLASWQERLTDLLFTPRRTSSDIAIIAIDDKSIQSIGRWPWDRAVEARLINLLKNPPNKPKAIGIDISFLEPSNPASDNLLASSLRDSNSVLAAEEVNGKILLPLEIFSQNSAGFGIVNTQADIDGIARRVDTKFEGLYDHFTVSILKASGGNLALPQSLRINFSGPPKTFNYYSFIDVLNGTVPALTFKDKIVLIGATAPDLHDDQIVPVSNKSPMPGVEIHANIVQMLKDKRFLMDQSRTATIGIIFAIGIILSAILMFLPVVLGAILTGLALTLYLAYASLSFDRGLVLNIIYPLLAVILVLIANILIKYFTESRLKAFIRKAFSYYLSEPVLNEILKNPGKLKLGGERKELTVLFSDIKGFTSISEKVEVEKLTSLLNRYLTAMTNIVFDNSGVLDKYIGDALMAFWGAPVESNHAYLACKTALEMQSGIQSLKETWKKEAGISDFEVRIGINTGEMTVGNMGSHSRFDYTVIGDNVNLGSRLEGINKEYGTRIIISEGTYEKVKGRVIARKLDQVAVKGKQKAVSIYELRGINTSGTSGGKEAEFLKKFEEARQEYQKGNFPKSLKLFKLLSNIYPGDGPAHTYISRLQTLAKDRPKNWTGVFMAKSK